MNTQVEHSTVLAVGAMVTSLLLAGVGCGDDPVRAQNYPSELTGIGPVTKSDSQVVVDYSIRDEEGDDQDIEVELCEATGEGAASEACYTPAQGAGSDGLRSLPTTPGGTDVPHRYAWAVGCGISDGECASPGLETDYVFRVSADGGETTIVSPVFSLSGLGFSGVPACEMPGDRAMSRPSACR